MPPKHLSILTIIIILVTLVGCSAEAAPPPEPSEVSSSEPANRSITTDNSSMTAPEIVLQISGSGSTTPILSAIQPAFEAATPGYRLKVLPGSGTGGGVKGVLQEVLDVAAMARPPKDKEAAQQVQYVEFGQAGKAVITHPDVGVTNLTVTQIQGIFASEITNWSEVGGPDQRIVLYVRDEGDSTTKELRENIIGDTPFDDTVAQVLTSQSDMLAAVERTMGSVGIATWPTTLAKGTNVSVVRIDGIAPGDPNYAMVGPLGIGFLANRQADVQPLADWLTSEQGQTALREFEIITGQ